MSFAENGVLNHYDEELKAHIEEEKAAVKLQSCIGNLLYSHSVELVLFRNHLYDRSTSEILDLHEYARNVVNKPMSVFDSADLANLLLEMDLSPSKIDIGRLAHEWDVEKGQYDSKLDFLQAKLTGFTKTEDQEPEPRDVVLFGFGRIGRLVARELVRQAGKGQQLRLRAIVVRNLTEAELVKRANLFKMDSVHGEFKGSVTVDQENQVIVINGQRVQMIASKDPANIDYAEYGIQDAVMIDNTGAFRDREGLGTHLKANGISKVLLTAPGKEVPNIVYGVNHKEFDYDNEDVWSAASCTTNAISTVLKVIEDNYGVEKGHVETIHAYTNDQNLLDNMHKKERRGRSAAINMVITNTGAGSAVTKVMPSFKDKLTANAVRVPTPNGSLAILSLTLKKDTSVDDMNATVRNAALNGDLVNQIHYSINPDLVSNDIIGNTCCSVFDSPATIVHPDGRNVVLYVWYDNEYGYTKQVIRLAKKIAKVQRLIYY